MDIARLNIASDRELATLIATEVVSVTLAHEWLKVLPPSPLHHAQLEPAVDVVSLLVEGGLVSSEASNRRSELAEILLRNLIEGDLTAEDAAGLLGGQASQAVDDEDTTSARAVWFLQDCQQGVTTEAEFREQIVDLLERMKSGNFAA